MENKDLKVVMVEDNEFFAHMLSEAMSNQFGYQVKVFHTGEEMLQTTHLQPDVILLDFQLNSTDLSCMNGDKVLSAIKKRWPETYVVMISSQSDVAQAIELLKHGACNYICKDVHSVKNTAQTLHHLQELIELKKEVAFYKTKSSNEQKRLAWLISAAVVILASSYFLG